MVMCECMAEVIDKRLIDGHFNKKKTKDFSLTKKYSEIPKSYEIVITMYRRVLCVTSIWLYLRDTHFS